MMTINFIILTLLFNLNNAEQTPKFGAQNDDFMYEGRYEFVQNNLELISPGASVSIRFSGSYCTVYLKGTHEPYNYVALELDNKYLGRVKIESDSIKAYTIKVTSKKQPHQLKIIKESEASNGAVIFKGITVKNILKPLAQSNFYIEFIGDSVTCGAAADSSITPCNTGMYFDQENVYYSYGVTLARALNVRCKISAVSGIGIYRNWNDENINEPIMPQVYQNLHLNTDASKPNNFNEIPDIVSICLGTNDLSNGDGKKERLPFNKEKYILNYINFIKEVYKHYPNTQIILLNSPMIIGDNNIVLVSCLKKVQHYFYKNHKKTIKLFEFKNEYVNGCSYHPSVKEHQEIADKLLPFFKNILQNK